MKYAAIAWFVSCFRKPEPAPEPEFVETDKEPPTSRPAELAKMGVGRCVTS